VLFRIKIFFVMLVGVLVLAAGSFAANSKPPAYRGNAGNVQNDVQGATNTLGSLPFTGLDLALIVGGGLVLVLAGVSLRRVASRRSAA
jgi:hypothetical protein